jgi:HlyD family secretion protein
MHWIQIRPKTKPISTPEGTPGKVQRRRWQKIGLSVAAGVVLVGLLGRVVNRLGNRNDPALLSQPVTRQTVPITISANGVVEAVRSINLSPKSSGVIKALLVNEGDRVQAGQVIAVMDDTNLRGQLLQSQAQLAQQQANLQRLIAGNRREDIARAAAQLAEAEANLLQLRQGNRPQEIAQAQAKLQQAQATLKQKQVDFQRYQRLAQQGAIARSELDIKQTDLTVAQTQVQEAQQALALQRAGTRSEQISQAQAKVEQQRQSLALLQAGSRPEEIAQARAQVLAAQGSLDTIQTQINDTQIRAPFAGVITKKYADVGAFVSPAMSGSGAAATSSSILTLASDRLEVVVNLSEAQISRVKPGQLVNLKIDALPGEIIRGKVDRIAPQATMSQNVTSFQVRVALDPVNSRQLKAGMNAEAEFAVGQVANALLVPNAAVVRQAETVGVYLLNQERQPVFQPIQIGATVGNQTEVKSGLQGNEQVLLSPPPDTKKPRSLGFPPAPPPGS